MLPSEKHIKQMFADSFMFYLPKDVVSGDFPWLYQNGDNTYIATIDCTGHGVPGAFMSLIGNFLLDQNMTNPAVVNPGLLLDYLHEGVKKTLKQEENLETRDGMDVALCKFNIKHKELEYAGAHRPLYIIRNNEIIEIKGDRYPIGGVQYKNREPFMNHKIQLKKNDAIYFFTDGLPDQTGGPEMKKFMTSKIKEILLNNNKKNMGEINTAISNEFYSWKANSKQVDDVLIIGIRM